MIGITRAFCVNRLLVLGHPPYLISKNLVHLQEMMSKKYEQLLEEDLLTQFFNED